jgi:catechol 2,3-dioxygenase-like lactoylglutathione lyase family enzyme
VGLGPLRSPFVLSSTETRALGLRGRRHPQGSPPFPSPPPPLRGQGAFSPKNLYLKALPAPGTTGLYHFAINYPTRKDLAVALKRLLDHGWSIDGASDHGTHEAIYLHDPDFNGIELAWDRHPSQWPRRDGAITFSRQPLDFASLLAELGEPDQAGYLAVLSSYK